VAGRATVSFVSKLTSYLALLSHLGSPAAPLRLVLAAVVALVSFHARLVWLSQLWDSGDSANEMVRAGGWKRLLR
jgi:hypothetical protein